MLNLRTLMNHKTKYNDFYKQEKLVKMNISIKRKDFNNQK